MKNIRDLLSRYISGLTWNCLWIFLFMVGFGVFFIGMPKFMDDYWYMMHLRPWFESQGIVYPENGGNIFKAGIPWEAILDTWYEHYEEDNIRLGNLVAPILLLFPKWIGSGICLACLVYSIIVGLGLTGIDWRNSRLAPVALFLCTFFMPWRDHWGALDYQLNYIVPTAISIGLIKCIYIADKHYTIKRVLIILLLSAIISMWHEGFSVPILGGLLGLVFIFKKCRRYYVFISMAILVAGTLILLSVPGMRIRMNGTDLHSELVLLYAFNAYSLEVFPFVLMLILTLIIIIKGKFIGIRKNSFFIFSFINALLSSIIVYCSSSFGRGCYWMSFMSILCIVCQLQILFPSFRKGYNVLHVTLAILMLCPVFLHLGSVDFFALKYREIMKKITRSYYECPENSYFCDFKILGKMPLVCGYLPDIRFSGLYISWYYSGSKENRWLGEEWLIPEQLELVDSNSGQLIPGGSDVRMTDGYMFASADGYEDPTPIIRMDFGKGYVPVPVDVARFRSNADGKYYIFLNPHIDWYVSHFKKVRGIRPFKTCNIEK